MEYEVEGAGQEVHQFANKYQLAVVRPAEKRSSCWCRMKSGHPWLLHGPPAGAREQNFVWQGNKEGLGAKGPGDQG